MESDDLLNQLVQVFVPHVSILIKEIFAHRDNNIVRLVSCSLTSNKRFKVLELLSQKWNEFEVVMQLGFVVNEKQIVVTYFSINVVIGRI